MKKRILSCLMALALCLTLLPTAALAEEPEGTAQTSQAVEEAADPANGKAKQENQPVEQEEQQEDSATKQDEDVAAVQAMIDALPDAAELDGMDDADAMEVYEAFQTACEAYYDTLTEGQQAQLKNTEKLAALSDWFSQLETLAAGEHRNHCVCGKTNKNIGNHSTHNNAFNGAVALWDDGGTLKKGENAWEIDTGTGYLMLDTGKYYLSTDLTLTTSICIRGANVTLCLNGKTIKYTGTNSYAILVEWNDSKTPGKLILTDCSGNNAGTISGGNSSAAVELQAGSDLDMYGGTITGSSKGVEFTSEDTVFNMYGGVITGNSSYGVSMTAGTFNMSGGEITGNNGGVFVGTDSAFEVSGKVKIIDNAASGKANNVHLNNQYRDKIFTVTSSNLQDGAKIGVTTEKIPSSTSTVKIASAFEGNEKYIESDQVGYEVQHDNNQGGMVLAIQEHQHCLCGETTCNGGNGHSKQEINFIPWTDAEARSQNSDKTASNSLPSKKGNYYLVGDVTLSNTWTPADGTVLCLNGHSITANGSITAIYVNNAFTLCDCKGGKDAYGQITHTAGMTGSGVNVLSGGVFHMYGGSITGNTADHGGGVYVGGGQFTMYGGEISGNTATVRGGGVSVSGGEFNMRGGTIGGAAADKANKAKNGGGGVHVSNSGEFTMSGSASITNNTADNGGGVYVGGGQFTMYGGEISGNTATVSGGGVSVSGGTFTMSGGRITGNNGSGVFVNDGTKFIVSGAPTVTGNTRNRDIDSNVYLTGGTNTTITIGTGGLTDGASIGVTKGASRLGSVIATGATKDYSGKFSSDDSTYVVKHEGDKLVLKKEETKPSEHSHTYGKWSKDDTNHWHQCTDADCPDKAESIKDKAAHVYDNDADATCNVCGYVRTVTPGNIPVSGVALNTTTATLEVGKTTTLTATVTPDNATDNKVTWTSSDTSVATVAANGTVTAVKAGTTAITATAADGSGKYATCTVTVTGGTTPSQPGGGGSSGGGGGSSSGSSSGGGGGSSSPSNHPVKAEVSKDPDGSVSLSKTSAAKGDKVTITVKPERYYEVDKVIVRDSKGKQLAVKDNGDGTFTFEMPADKVTVEPSFSWVNPFADVADSAYYVDAVEWMLKREVTQGTTETTFSPDLNCTRAQIVTFLWRVAGSPEAKGTVSFADVSADSYYAKAVAWAVENGITDGIGGGLFSPDATCTRAQSAVFLYRVAGSPAVNGSAGFSDVAADAYYAQAVAWAKEHGITDGIGGGLFGSDNDCTRAQIAAFLYRYMK